MHRLEGGTQEGRLMPTPGLKTFLEELHGSETASSKAMEQENG